MVRFKLLHSSRLTNKLITLKCPGCDGTTVIVQDLMELIKGKLKLFALPVLCDQDCCPIWDDDVDLSDPEAVFVLELQAVDSAVFDSAERVSGHTVLRTQSSVTAPSSEATPGSAPVMDSSTHSNSSTQLALTSQNAQAVGSAPPSAHPPAAASAEGSAPPSAHPPAAAAAEGSNRSEQSHSMGWGHQQQTCAPAGAASLPAPQRVTLDPARRGQGKWDVFISHRGPDTKSSMVESLKRKLGGRTVYVDKHECRKGQHAWSDIEDALLSARIVLVIMSPNFQSSAYCMEELCLALARHKAEGNCVRPVFWNVRPGSVDMRSLTEAAHEYRSATSLGSNPKIMDEWVQAMKDLGDISGFVSTASDIYDDVLEEIAQDINRALPALPVCQEAVVGRDSLVSCVMKELKALQGTGVAVVGLHGMGGVGKSTIAKKLYDLLCAQEGFVLGAALWLDQCRSASRVQDLQSDILKHYEARDCTAPSETIGRQMIASLLANKRVLLVLDDVDPGQSKRLLDLAGLGSGSVVILTSRSRTEADAVASNEQLVVKVQPLEESSAAALFDRFATSIPASVDRSLHRAVVRKCQGLPLSLKVLAAHLNNRESGYWQESLALLQEGCDVGVDDDKQIFKLLRISFDALDDIRKEMFLDIACVLHGQTPEFAKAVWQSRGKMWPGLSGLDDLIARNLVDVVSYVFTRRAGGGLLVLHAFTVDLGFANCIPIEHHVCRLHIHDHLKDLGQQIQQDRGWRLHRIWSPLQTLETLELGKKLIGKGELAFTCWTKDLVEAELQGRLVSVDCRPHRDKIPVWMKLLQAGLIPGGSSINHLKMLQAPCCLQSTQTLYPSHPCFDVHLALKRRCNPRKYHNDLQRNNRMWTLLPHPGITFRTLHTSVGKLGALQHLDLRECTKLDSLPDSIGNLTALQQLRLNGARLTSLPESIGCLTALKQLMLDQCIYLTSLPDSIGKLAALQHLQCTGRLRMTYCESSLRHLPDAIANLTALEQLNLRGCKCLTSLPELIGNLTALQQLDLAGCECLTSWPDSISNLTALKHLDLSVSGFYVEQAMMQPPLQHHCSSLSEHQCRSLSEQQRLDHPYFKCLAESISNLTALERLSLSGCRNLMSLPHSVGNLAALQRLDLRSCANLTSLPASIGNLTALERLSLSGCRNLMSLPQSVGNVTALQRLDLRNCDNLTSLPESIGNLTALERLHLSGCRKLMSLPQSVYNLTALRRLDLNSCDNLTSLPESIGNLSALESLDLSGCRNLMSLPQSVGNLTALRRLDLSSCDHLTSLPESIGNLSALDSLDLSGCRNLMSLPQSVGNLAVLQYLQLRGCDRLTSLPESICDLSALRALTLVCCSQLTSLPESISCLTALQFELDGCSSLTSLPVSIGNLRTKQIDIHGFNCLTSLPESIGNLTTVTLLDMHGCSSLRRLPESIGNLAALQQLDMEGCSSLTSVPESIGNLCTLQRLRLNGCNQLTSLPECIGNLAALQLLDLNMCESLSELPVSIGGLTALQELSAYGWHTLTSLPRTISSLTALQLLDLGCCSSMIALPKSIGRLTALEVLSLYQCSGLTCLPACIGCLTALRQVDLSCCSSLVCLPWSIGNLIALEELDLLGCSSLVCLPSCIVQLTALQQLDLRWCSNLVNLADCVAPLTALQQLALVADWDMYVF